MRTPFKFSSGSRGETLTALHTTGVTPKADSVQVNEGEGIGSIAMRGYGANTPTNRQKINQANATLSGKVRLPR